MKLTIRTDGGSRGNPGPAAAGVVIRDEQGRRIFAQGYFLGETTSNVAEYEGLLRALEAAQKLGGTKLKIYSDSELMVRQVNGEYRVKKEHLQHYYRDVLEHIGRFEKAKLRHVKREDNIEADELVNRALDARGDVSVDLEEAYVESEEKPTVTMVDIDGLIQFRETGPYRERIFSNDGVLADLVCLAAGQKGQVDLSGERVLVTVMRGAGEIGAGEEGNLVKAGTCLYLGNVASLELAADAEKALVAVITQVI